MLNQYKIVGDVLVVYNRKDGREMLFDAEDFDLVSKYTWFIDKTGYARTNIKCVSTLAHRVLIKITDNRFIDHINNDRKDNRKKNLRLVSPQENCHNIQNVKGYYLDKVQNKWVANIKFNNKSIYLGRYNTEDEARAAYLQAKKIYHPSAPHHLYK